MVNALQSLSVTESISIASCLNVKVETVIGMTGVNLGFEYYHIKLCVVLAYLI